jgi:long-chain fatty acid transport protein
MGVSYKLSEHMTLNASYAHVFIDKQVMNRTDIVSGPNPLTTVTTHSQASGNVDMIATSVTARF